MVENSASYRARNPLVPSVNPTATGLGVSATLPAPEVVISPPLTAQELAKLFLTKQPVERDEELRKLKQSQPDMHAQVYSLLRKDVIEQQAQSKPAEQPRRATQIKQPVERTTVPAADEKPPEPTADPALLSKLAASAGVRNQATT